ncbi:Pleckstrin homology domain-containing family M member 1 [Geodia barretti]|uniref:Pleckstrin homology domain-containing family M member 1 n=1 Tax=Geodia barretti TaxID=519541 RepID=A0AA35S625_GEOBA|nr:Pleckstrin homology domain-containing family M member 1 [Geodia barretti]
MVSDEIKTQLMALRDSESDVMKCRSWLRIMLNKSLLLSFLEDLQRHPGLLSFHYGGESVLRDAERLEIVIQLLRGLSTIQLGYDYTISSLTTWDSSVLQKAGIWQDSSSPNTRRDGERVSPPPTSFGVGVVNMALGRYSRSSSLSQSSETQIISREAASQQEEGGAPQGRSSAGGGRGNRGQGSEDFSYAKSLDFEVVSEKTGGPVHRTLTSLLTKLVPERGLDSQNYCCAACRRPIGVSESSYLHHLHKSLSTTSTNTYLRHLQNS